MIGAVVHPTVLRRSGAHAAVYWFALSVNAELAIGLIVQRAFAADERERVTLRANVAHTVRDSGISQALRRANYLAVCDQ